MQVLVTGSTGHLGANLVRAALATGHAVRALARPTSNRAGLEGLDVEVVTGDLLDAGSIRDAVDGVEVVFHCAAVHRNWAADEDAILRPAVEGTANVLRAAADAGVKRVVYTSSNATIGYPPAGGVWDESHSMTGARSPYVRAKCAAEAEALRLAPSLGVDLVVVNPCGILGPWDYKPTPTTRAIVDVAHGGPVMLDVALTHVEDVAYGHLLAADRGASGERYLLAGENATRDAIAEGLTGIFGHAVRAILPPRWMLRIVAWTEMRKVRGSGGDPGLTPEQLEDVYGRSLFYDSSKARATLGWAPRPTLETLLDTSVWLAARGMLPPRVAEHVRGLRPPGEGWLAA